MILHLRWTVTSYPICCFTNIIVDGNIMRWCSLQPQLWFMLWQLIHFAFDESAMLWYQFCKIIKKNFIDCIYHAQSDWKFAFLACMLQCLDVHLQTETCEGDSLCYHIHCAIASLLVLWPDEEFIHFSNVHSCHSFTVPNFTSLVTISLAAWPPHTMLVIFCKLVSQLQCLWLWVILTAVL